jgi:hypothetical protein
MISSTTIGCETALAGYLKALSATLPKSFRAIAEARMDEVDVWLIDGSGPWADVAMRCADSGSGKIVVVVDPGMDDPDAIRQLTASIRKSSSRIALIETFPGNPALPGFLEDLPDSVSYMHFQAWTTGNQGNAVLSQLRLARALGLEDIGLKDICALPDSCLLSLQALRCNSRLSLRFLVTASSALPARHVIRGYAADALAILTLFDRNTARPAEALVTDASGQHLLPAIYETAHRFMLRNLGNQTVSLAELAAFADDVELTRSLGLN